MPRNRAIIAQAREGGASAMTLGYRAIHPSGDFAKSAMTFRTREEAEARALDQPPLPPGERWLIRELEIVREPEIVP